MLHCLAEVDAPANLRNCTISRQGSVHFDVDARKDGDDLLERKQASPSGKPVLSSVRSVRPQLLRLRSA